MGAGNVGLVYARWGHLPHAPFRVLAYMALRTLDDGDPPRFWGGRESLAVALGRSASQTSASRLVGSTLLPSWSSGPS